MLYLLIKAAISGAIVAAASEVARRWPGVGGLIVSLPLVSLLAMIWLWRDSGDSERVAQLAQGAFWFFLPSMPLFLVLPAMLRAGIAFWLALGARRCAHGGALSRNVLARPARRAETLVLNERPASCTREGGPVMAKIGRPSSPPPPLREPSWWLTQINTRSLCRQVTLSDCSGSGRSRRALMEPSGPSASPSRMNST